MRKIKVGEYFRTHDGRIGKIRRFLEKDPCFYNMNYYMTDILYRMPGCYLSYRIYEDMITKHSPNIIDLIEKDDYINGCRVYKVEEHGVTVYQQTEDGVIDYNWICRSDIKSIVTHESFNSIKYEVE